MTRSGVRPLSVKGMSSWWAMRPTTPFCPCRDANLSPTSGHAEVAGPDFHEAGTVLALGDDDRVDNAVLVAAHRDGGVAALLDRNQFTGRFLEEPRRGGLADQHILLCDNGLGVDHAVFVKVLVGLGTVGTGNVLFGDFDPVDLAAGIPALFAFVGPEEVGTAEAALDRGLVEDERIFNIVAFVREDGDDEVLACRPVVGSDQFRGLGVGERFLHVVEQVAAGVGAELHVRRAETERLLDHACAHRDTRTRIVLGERDVCRTDTEDQGGVDLEVGVVGGRVLGKSMAMRRSSSSSASMNSIMPRWTKEEISISFFASLLEVLVGDQGLAVFQDDEGAARTAAVGQDHDIAVVFLVGDVHFRRDRSLPAHAADIGDQCLRVVDKADEGTVNKYA